MLTFDQISSPLPLMGTEGMQDSLGDLVVLGIPEAGMIVQDRHQISMAALQMVAQGLSKQGMIAIPLAIEIQRHDKEIGLLELFEQLSAASLLHDGVTESSSEAFQDTGGEQKGLHLLRLSPWNRSRNRVKSVALFP